MRIDNETKLDFGDVLIRPKRSTLQSRSDVQLNRGFNFRNGRKMQSVVPIISSNMDTTGTFEIAQELARHSMLTCIHKHYQLNDWEKFWEQNEVAREYVAVSAGTGEQDVKRLIHLLDRFEIHHICMDVANGYSEHFADSVRRVRELFPNKIIMAGNVVTGEMTEQLILSGADIVKVGIGPGSVCTTRKKTGVGYPQISAVIECADAAHGMGGHIISDGGCTVPGDIAKAFGAGADFVMCGGIFAGHEECGGEQVMKNGKMYREFYGMSSETAMNRHSGGVANYRASEGKYVLIPDRGPVGKTCLDILGGLRSACSYVGAASLKDLSKRTTFIRVTQQTNEVFSRLE